MLDSEKLVQLARTHHHKPYSLRSWKISELYDRNPLNFDCSSFTMWLYFTLGFKLPRRSQWQFNYCQSFQGQPRIGDLYFLAPFRRRTDVNHVGMYIGSGMCIEAAGGRAMKVIYSQKTRIEDRLDFLEWRRVPLEMSEDSFFRFVKLHPISARDNSKTVLM